MNVESGTQRMGGLLAALIGIGLLVLSLLAVVIFVDPVPVQPNLTQTATYAFGTPSPTASVSPDDTLPLSSPVVNIDGIAIISALLVLIVLVAVYREIRIYLRSTKK